ncbi:MAG TPA: hypothetical protein VGX48_11235 [Pyrinomonadaceae bacterium]|jgi:hypothetical protein|nr:hypothetical protein [Pyrinomonadaceae bacterium]
MQTIATHLLLLLPDCYTAGRSVSMALMSLALFGLGGWMIKAAKATPVGELKGLRKNAHRGMGVKVGYGIAGGWFVFCGLVMLLALIFRTGC